MRNRLFTGREDVLEKLQEALQRDRRAALSGLGGIGKTQTAIEYAHRYRNDYDAVFFIRTDTETALTAGMIGIASVLALPRRDAKDQNETMSAVKRWLQEHDRWLLIADNADELALIKNVLPFDTPGQILLTTRAAGTGAVAEAVKVEKMEPEEGAHLLLRRAGLLGRASGHQPAPGDQQTAARDLSIKLDGLPLALDQAGAFIEETPSSLIEYLQLYAEAGAELRRMGKAEHDSVHATFSLAFEKVRSASSAAADLLRLCAFFAPDQIPEEIFINGAPELGENLGALARNTLGRIEMIGQACRFSLLHRDAISKALSIHRQVQAVLRDMMAEKGEERLWAERSVRAVNRAFPDVKFSIWAVCDRLLAQAQTCAELINQWDFEFPECTRLCNQAGFYLYERGRYAEAKPLYERALAIRERALGAHHPHVALSLNNLAGLYRALGQYAKAEPLYERALAIREKALGPEHPDVAQSLNNLATLYYAQGGYAKAEPLHKTALAIREKVLGPEHPDVATSLNDLALVYRARGHYAKAEPLNKRALAIYEKSLGPEHPYVAASLNNLAALYDDQGQYAMAEPLYERALTIRQKTLGPNHPDVATALNNLATLHNAQGQYAKAKPLYHRALAIYEKALGPEHLNVALSLQNLAVLYYNQGQYAMAEPLYRRALATMEKALGSEHPDFATSLHNLALIYDNEGQYALAEPLYKRALAIKEKALGSEHLDVAQSVNSLALLYRSQGLYAMAEPLYWQALTILKKIFGPEHPNVATSLNNLAGLLRDTNRLAEAEPLYQRSLNILEKAVGTGHPNIAITLENYASLLRSAGRGKDAEPLEARAKAIRTKSEA